MSILFKSDKLYYFSYSIVNKIYNSVHYLVLQIFILNSVETPQSQREIQIQREFVITIRYYKLSLNLNLAVSSLKCGTHLISAPLVEFTTRRMYVICLRI